MEWEKVIYDMLGAFQQQAIFSLGLVKEEFERQGLKFDEHFRQHFFTAANNRLTETYNQFELNLHLEKSSANQHFDINAPSSNQIDKDNKTLIEIDDSDDESENETNRSAPIATVLNETVNEINVNRELNTTDELTVTSNNTAKRMVRATQNKNIAATKTKILVSTKTTKISSKRFSCQMCEYSTNYNSILHKHMQHSHQNGT
ncbi:uncharacterized protein LOC116350933 [Contarinia nasturtii]|uniref:uncharacterized protein LOC116350933 n=1 Tax=Contarinia nasturtii TaxID=265458 RepID=UPI0012D37F0C|nr:uncharacterized protein LOC116350933 [Contarinia nasturtii]